MQLQLTNHSLHLSRELGAGSFGSVWLAEHPATDVVLATKLLPIKKGSLKRFYREVLNHDACKRQ
jgi:serine/threonine protein kinase